MTVFWAKKAAAAAVACLAFAGTALAQENVVNVYSGRHYQTDEKLYSGFTKATGIKINRIEAGEDAIIERIRNEGARSPADVMITVDAGRLWRADQLGLFQPVKSKFLESRIPASLREPNGHWFGFSTRARVIAPTCAYSGALASCSTSTCDSEGSPSLEASRVSSSASGRPQVKTVGSAAWNRCETSCRNFSRAQAVSANASRSSRTTSGALRSCSSSRS